MVAYHGIFFEVAKSTAKIDCHLNLSSTKSQNTDNSTSGRSLVAERELPKLEVGVRFPPPAPC